LQVNASKKGLGIGLLTPPEISGQNFQKRETMGYGGVHLIGENSFHDQLPPEINKPGFKSLSIFLPKECQISIAVKAMRALANRSIGNLIKQLACREHETLLQSVQEEHKVFIASLKVEDKGIIITESKRGLSELQKESNKLGQT